MKLYDKILIEIINNILLFEDKIEISKLGPKIKKELQHNNIKFFLKGKVISPNTYLKYKHTSLFNFICKYMDLTVVKNGNMIDIKIKD